MKTVNKKRKTRASYLIAAVAIAAALVIAGCKSETSSSDTPSGGNKETQQSGSNGNGTNNGSQQGGGNQSTPQDPSTPNPNPQPNPQDPSTPNPNPQPNPEDPPLPPPPAVNNNDYQTVKFSGLDAFLAKAPSDKTTLIEITELTAENLKGDGGKASALGSILQKYPTKKVALKFGGSITGLTDMHNSFRDCTNLESLTQIPEGVQKMKYCFAGCTNLKESPSLPSSLTEMDYTFEKCESLTTMPSIPPSVTAMSHCFEGCTALITVSSLPSTLQYMDQCFLGCSALTTAPDVPASVKDLEQCFLACTKLTSVCLKCNYDTLNSSDGAFSGCTSLPDGGIKVPAGELAKYKAAAGMMGTTAEKFAEDK